MGRRLLAFPLFAFTLFISKWALVRSVPRFAAIKTGIVINLVPRMTLWTIPHTFVAITVEKMFTISILLKLLPIG